MNETQEGFLDPIPSLSVDQQIRETALREAQACASTGYTDVEPILERAERFEEYIRNGRVHGQ